MSEYLYRVKFISGWDVEPNFTNDYPIIEQAINNTCNELENEYRVNKIEFHELKKAYLKFLKKSQVSDLYAREDDVVDPTVETEGNFRYPVISERMRYMIFYLRENDLGDSTKARQFARERIAKLGGDSNTQVKSAIDRLFYVMNGSMAI